MNRSRRLRIMLAALMSGALIAAACDGGDDGGVSWQIIPKQLGELRGDPDPVKSQRVMQAMLQMRKIIVADLEKAHALA